MADLSDVGVALKAAIVGAIYPNGTSQPSVVGYPCKVAVGWPIPDQVDMDLQGLVLGPGGVGTKSNGVGPIVNVSIYPQPNIERVTTRYQREWVMTSNVTPTITGTVSGNTVTIGGTATANHYITIIINDLPFSYGLLATDTPSSVAAALAALVSASYSATAAGDVITLPATLSGLISVNTGAPGVAVQEIRRQQHGFQIVIWAPSNAARIAACEVIDPLLAATDFLTMPDGTGAWMLYRGQNDSDNYEKAALYRRDLFYWVEYATTLAMTNYPITAAPVTLTAADPTATI